MRILTLALISVTLIGCGSASMRIKVDVYKGPLANTQHIQEQQLAALLGTAGKGLDDIDGQLVASMCLLRCRVRHIPANDKALPLNLVPQPLSSLSQRGRETCPSNAQIMRIGDRDRLSDRELSSVCPLYVRMREQVAGIQGRLANLNVDFNRFDNSRWPSEDMEKALSLDTVAADLCASQSRSCQSRIDQVRASLGAALQAVMGRDATSTSYDAMVQALSRLTSDALPAVAAAEKEIKRTLKTGDYAAVTVIEALRGHSRMIEAYESRLKKLEDAIKAASSANTYPDAEAALDELSLRLEELAAGSHHKAMTDYGDYADQLRRDYAFQLLDKKVELPSTTTYTTNYASTKRLIDNTTSQAASFAKFYAEANVAVAKRAAHTAKLKASGNAIKTFTGALPALGGGAANTDTDPRLAAIQNSNLSTKLQTLKSELTAYLNDAVLYDGSNLATNIQGLLVTTDAAIQDKVNLPSGISSLLANLQQLQDFSAIDAAYAFPTGKHGQRLNAITNMVAIGHIDTSESDVNTVVTELQSAIRKLSAGVTDLTVAEQQQVSGAKDRLSKLKALIGSVKSALESELEADRREYSELKSRELSKVSSIAMSYRILATFLSYQIASVPPKEKRLSIDVAKLANLAAEYANQLTARANALSLQTGDAHSPGVPRELLSTGQYLRDTQPTAFIEIYDWLDAATDGETDVRERIDIAKRLFDDDNWANVNEVYASGLGKVSMAGFYPDISDTSI
ncbi:MAG: hypothetical protein AAF515_19180 [Pseudomonadota bacterium]